MQRHFFLILLLVCFALSPSYGIEGHTVPPMITPVDSLFPLSFFPQVRPTGGGIPGYPKPKPYALLGLGSYSAKDSWTIGGRAEGRLFFLSGTAKGLVVRRTDFGPSSENDFSLKGSAAYRSTGQIAFEARFRGIEADDELGDVRRAANSFAISVRESDRKGNLTVLGSWTDIYLDVPERTSLRSFKLVREGERLFDFGTKQGRVREAWMISEEQSNSLYPERLWGKAFLAGGLRFGDKMFLELGARVAGYSALFQREAFAYPYLSLRTAHPGGYSATLSFEPTVHIVSFEDRYLFDPYLLVNPGAGYARSPVRLTEALEYASPWSSLAFQASQERWVSLWLPQDALKGFLMLQPYGELWKYTLEAKAAATAWKHLHETIEVKGYRANGEVPYDPRLVTANTLSVGRGTDSLRVKVDYVGRRFRPREESLKAYALVSVEWEWKAYPGIQAALSVENLGDNRYELISGRTHRGRTFSLGLSCRI